MKQQDLLFDDFTLGLLLGVLLTLLVLVAFVAIPALWWEWQDRHPTVDVDELLDLDRCDMCLVLLTDDIQAITCDAHRYCGDCDDHTNRCTACAYARGLALIEEDA